MKLSLSPEQESLHKKAIDLCRRHRDLEWQIIEVLQKIEQTQLYKKLEVTSLFQYAVRFLNLSESMAYAFISVARKATAIPDFGGAVKNQSLSVNKAARILSVLTPENSAELVAFARDHSIRAIDFEVARRNPRAARRESAKPISADYIEIKCSLPRATFEKLRRAQAVLAQQQSKNPDIAQALDAILDDYLKRNDPVKKAERAVKKQQLCKTESPTSIKNPGPPTRTPLKAPDKHQVYARDEGRCTYRDSNGNRCENEKWLHLHHVRPVSQGGGNDPENVVTLCSTHHDLVHQLSLPLDGQVTWLREPARRYG